MLRAATATLATPTTPPATADDNSEVDKELPFCDSSDKLCSNNTLDPKRSDVDAAAANASDVDGLAVAKAVCCCRPSSTDNDALSAEWTKGEVWWLTRRKGDDRCCLCPPKAYSPMPPAIMVANMACNTCCCVEDEFAMDILLAFCCSSMVENTVSSE